MTKSVIKHPSESSLKSEVPVIHCLFHTAATSTASLLGSLRRLQSPTIFMECTSMTATSCTTLVELNKIAQFRSEAPGPGRQIWPSGSQAEAVNYLWTRNQA